MRDGKVDVQITVIAVGTRGDVQPLIALAKGLRDAGHLVCVATLAEFETLVREQGLRFFELRGSPSQMMQSADMLVAMGGNRNPLALLRGIVNTIRPQFEQGLADVWAACQGTDAIVLSMLGFYAGYHVAEKLDVPFFEAYVLPGRPSRAFPSPVLGMDLHMGGSVNWLSHTVLLQIGWQLLQPMTNHARQVVLDMPPISLREVFRNMEREMQPILYGFSAHVLPKPRDWPEWHHVTGYWFLERPTDWQPPSGLDDFLESGPPPVYIGFGSMTGRDPERVAEIVLEALRRSRQRGLLLTGWGGISTSDLPDDVFKIESAPHDWLFPRVAAVVHHGGSGTTAAGLRAGVPSIVVPFGGDQFLWGRCVSRLSAGPEPIPRSRLTVERLTQAIRTATESDPIRTGAAVLGKRIRAENGVRKAVGIIERTLRRA